MITFFLPIFKHSPHTFINFIIRNLFFIIKFNFMKFVRNSYVRTEEF
jgi:hypothetical protein